MASLPVICALLLAGLGTPVQADAEPTGPIPPPFQVQTTIPAPLQQPAAAKISATLSGGACTGSAHWTVNPDAPGDARLMLRGLTGVSPPDDKAANPAVAIAAVAIVVAIVLFYMAQEERAEDAVLKWEWNCAIQGFQVEGTGSGSYLRRVGLEFAPYGQYTSYGTQCEYDGVLVDACVEPARYGVYAEPGSDGIPAGGQVGESYIRWDSEGNQYLDPPFPTVVKPCIDPAGRVVNAPQHEELKILGLPAYDYLPREVCSGEACIIWSGDKQGCLRPVED